MDVYSIPQAGLGKLIAYSAKPVSPTSLTIMNRSLNGCAIYD
jgi:hypothetical protein